MKDTWQQSLFMPKEAARIFLKVTDVRVEWLQDITEEQAKSEGTNVAECDLECSYTNIDEFCGIWNYTVDKSKLICMDGTLILMYG